MSVSEHLMATGTWDLALRPDTPYSITDRLGIARAGFSHIHITRTAFNAVEVGADRLWDLAIYSGVYRRQEGRTRFKRIAGVGIKRLSAGIRRGTGCLSPAGERRIGLRS